MTRKVAGCVPVRLRRSVRGGEEFDEWEVLLVQSRWVPQVWLFPKGGIEKHEKAKAAAVRETREEAGVIGRVGPKVGQFRLESTPGQTIKLWILFVGEELASNDKRWKERKSRARQWLTFPEARNLMTSIDPGLVRPELVEILERSRSILSTSNVATAVLGNDEDDTEDDVNEGDDE
uniref:Nudix hydrolase domain-containing protein n=1 Tax=Compsopogon caeruleus TaxID=31354 RepID=A0A7S1XEM2_9RHOD|mmetsp:Transcript_5901/g.11649  ORF Transcript_5901/g.11649 Transcript_5901/m.11649 type:complete len:177 (+) Transcript_5901:306-836(+)|eukprot:CAMPEP_0184686922 /NCGR_PEP_ID=MMETSP0312-20130426/24641_1 /TAXON_ID=31354 /ORGANISM="Compsopogon coeruleus, Strain SAG 36.94" /LENGTH=176 /DNA_ID=CAMNT_0027142545 /DNA_START=244 /DNA_END=774 /DNA_ORIENTATION=-